MEFLTFLILFVLLPTLFVYLFKPQFIDFELFFILIKLRKAMWIFDFFANKAKNFWYFLSEYGIVLGFGIFGTIYLKKKGITLKKCLIYQGIHLVFSIFLILLINGNFNILHYFILSIFGSSIYMIFLIGVKAIKIIHDYLNGAKIISPGIAPLLPKETGIKFKNNPIQIPLYAFLVLILIVIIHELFHGILCRLEGIKIKSYGLLFLGLLPAGAFVEPDDKELERTESLKKTRMFAAGSMGNIITFIIFFISLITTTYIINKNPNLKYYVAYNITNLENNISQNIIKNHIYIWYSKPGENFVFLKDISENKSIRLNLSLDQFLGSIEYKTIVYPKHNYWIFLIVDLLKWGTILSLMLALVNYIPLLIFDGARMLDEIVKTIFPNLRKHIIIAINLTLLLLFIINMLPLFI